MKTLASILPIVLLLLGACQSIELPEQEDGTKVKKQKVSITARSSTSTPLSYPLTVYAFDASGKCVTQQQIDAADKPLVISLASGAYTIVALSGQGAYSPASAPAKPVLSTNLEMLKAENYADLPLMRGEATVQVGSAQSKVRLSMNYCVASIELQLSGIPDNITEVQASLDQQYSLLSMEGLSNRPKPTRLQLLKQEDATWKSGIKYVFPGARSNTAITLTLVSSGEERHYAALLSVPFRAATPYRLSGQYSTAPGEEGFQLTGEVVTGSWNEPINETFAFGPGVKPPPSQNPEQDDNPPSENVSTRSIPQPGSIWQDAHVVALVDNATATEADLLLLSTTEWDNLHSANSAINPQAAQQICDNYVEKGMTGWNIPTQEEARRLARIYNGETLAALNRQMQKLGGDIIYESLGNKYVRYLCDKGKYTFAFRVDSNVLQAGEKVKNYHMRLVKRVHVTVRP